MFASLATLARSQSREISIEHPCVGLASLAQLCCRYVGVCLSYVKLTARAELRAAQSHAQSLFFLAVKPVTPLLFISYTLEF